MFSLFRFGFFTIILIISNPAFSNQVTWLEYPESGVVLGQGYNTLLGEPTFGTCVDFVPVQDPSQRLNYKFEEVTSHLDAKSHTEISASGALKMAILKASAKLKFVSDEKYTSNTTKFYLSFNAENSALFASPSLPSKKGSAVPNLMARVPEGEVSNEGHLNLDELSDLSKIKLKTGETAKNINKCGHGFVAAIVSGGSLDAFLSFEESNSDNKSSIDGSLKASIASIFTVRGSFEQKLELEKRQSRSIVRVMQRGGSGGQISYNVETLKQSFANLPTVAKNHPRPIRIAIATYDKLDQFPEAIGANASSLVTTADAYFLTLDAFNSTSEVIEKYWHYNDPNFKRAPIYLAAKQQYHSINNRSLKLLNDLSRELALCQNQMNKLNVLLSYQAEKELCEELEGESKKICEDNLPAKPSYFNNSIMGIDKNASSTKIADSISDLYGDPNQPIQAPLFKASLKSGEITADDFQYQLNNFSLAKPVSSSLGLGTEAGEENETNCIYKLNPLVGRAAIIGMEELKFRPLFWDTLSNHEKSNIKDIIKYESAGQTKTLTKEQLLTNTETLNRFYAKVALVLSEHQKFDRAGKIRRKMCKLDPTSTYCGLPSTYFEIQTALPISSYRDFPEVGRHYMQLEHLIGSNGLDLK